jgi:hypothetical protein
MGLTPGVRFSIDATFCSCQYKLRIQMDNEAISLEVNRSDREADYSVQPPAKVNNGGGVPPRSHKSSWCGA